MLPELSIPKPEYVYSVTEDMYMRLEQEKEELLQRFMERYRIDGIHESDIVMEKLLRELEQIKDMPFPETIETQIELAAVWGYIIIRDVGGEWVKKKSSSRLEINNCSFSAVWENPLETVSHCCQKGGRAALAKRYVTLYQYRDRQVEYMYKKFCCYEDEAELCEQLEIVSGEIKEAVLAGNQIKNRRDRCLVMIPEYADDSKKIEIPEEMKSEGIYARIGGNWYFRVTEEQYGELIHAYVEALNLAEEKRQEVTYSYEELFGE